MTGPKQTGRVTLAFASRWTSPAIPGLSQSAIDIMNTAPYANAGWAVRVTDLTTGHVLVDYNSDLLVEPASVTKTYSVGAAWLKFGPDSRVVTPIVRRGRVRAGVLTGDLVLVAKGDITMGGQTGPDGRVVFTNMDHNDANLLPGAMIAENNPLAGLDRLARKVKASGITTVSGDVVIDDRLFVTQDLGENDGPVSPIIISNNLIDLVTLPTRPGAPASIRMRPIVAPWTIDNRVRTVAANRRTSIVVTSDDAGVITLTGTIAAGSAPALKVWPITDPATFARTAFIEALGRAGVSVTAPAVRTNSTVDIGPRSHVGRLPEVASLAGMRLSENATYILKISYNRGAQTQLQTAFAHRADAARWRAALPIMGVDGSIATVQVHSPAAGHVSAKTGTLGAGGFLNGRLRLETKALGGYLTAKSGRELAIMIVADQAVFSDIQGVFAANEDIGRIATNLWESY